MDCRTCGRLARDRALKPVLPVLLDKVKEENRKRLLSVRTFAAWVQFDNPVQVQAVFDCGSERAAKELQTFFNLPDDAANPNGKDGWLIVQISTSLEKVREALER